MKRLICPLIYILGFSVFCACTTTKTTPIEDVSASEEIRDLYLVLTDGSTLDVTSATVSVDEISGVITVEDSERLEAYFQTWGSSPRGRRASNSSSIQWNEYTVVIPRSDVSEVQITETNGLAIAMLVVAVPFGLLLYGLSTIKLFPEN